MPADGDASDPEQVCHVSDAQSFQIVHDDRRAAARRQPAECTPDRAFRMQRALDIRVVGTLDERSLFSDPLFAPQVPLSVDEHPNQPGLFGVLSARNGGERFRSPEECFLNEVLRLLA